MAEGAIGVTATCAADRAGAAHAEATTSATGDSRCSSAPGRARNADFLRRKEQILASLDRSPKGSLDAPITELLAWLNAQSSVVTTSSCSGRISVFLGASDPSSSKGGQWLLISHEALGDATATWARVTEDLQRRSGTAGEGLRGTLASLLLEPFVLHAECADADTAQRILEAARETGFRESGISLGRRRVMVQVRTLALRLEVPLALDGRLLTEEAHFQTLVHLANERLAENARRVERLWARLREALRTAAAEAAAAAAHIMNEHRKIACVEIELLKKESETQLQMYKQKLKESEGKIVGLSRERDQLNKQRDEAIQEANMWRSELAKAREHDVILEAAVVRAEEKVRVAEANAEARVKEALQKEAAALKEKEELLAYVNVLKAQLQRQNIDATQVIEKTEPCSDTKHVDLTEENVDKACLSVSRAIPDPVPAESVVHMATHQVNIRPLGDSEWSDIQATEARVADVREVELETEGSSLDIPVVSQPGTTNHNEQGPNTFNQP